MIGQCSIGSLKVFEEGQKFICQHDDWINAYGNSAHALHKGMRVTVTGSVRIAGTTFLSFKETPEGNYYLYTGFKSLRSLN